MSKDRVCSLYVCAVCLIIISIPLSAAEPPIPQQVLDWQKTAKDYVTQGKMVQAVESYQKIQQFFPDTLYALDAQCSIVRLHLQGNQPDKAIKALAEMRQKYASRPEYVWQAHELAWDFARKRENTAARQILADLQKEFPNHEKAVLLQRSVIQSYLEEGDSISEGQVRLAVEQMKANYQSHPDYVNQMATVADWMRCTRYSKIAGGIYDNLLEQFQNHKEAVLWKQFRQIEKALDSGQMETAKSGVETLFSTYRDEPEFVKHVHGVGWDFEQKGDYSTAVKIYTDLLKYFPNHERAVWFQRSIVEAYLYHQGDMEKVRQAVEDLKNNFRSHPDYTNQMTTMADRLRGKNQYALSKGIYDCLIEQFPKHLGMMWLLYGRACSEIGMKQPDLAAATIETIRQKYSWQPDYPDALRLIAYEYRHVGYYLQAMELDEYVLSLNPDPAAQIRCITDIARVYARLGNDAKVQEKVDYLLSHFKDNSEEAAVYLLGVGEEYLLVSFTDKELKQPSASYQESLSKSVWVWEAMISRLPEDNPYLDDVWFYYGCVFYLQGDFLSSLDCHTYLIERWPDSRQVWGSLQYIGYSYEWLYTGGFISEQTAKELSTQSYKTLLERFPNCPAAQEVQDRLNQWNDYAEQEKGI